MHSGLTPLQNESCTEEAMPFSLRIYHIRFKAVRFSIAFDQIQTAGKYLTIFLSEMSTNLTGMKWEVSGVKVH